MPRARLRPDVMVASLGALLGLAMTGGLVAMRAWSLVDVGVTLLAASVGYLLLFRGPERVEPAAEAGASRMPGLVAQAAFWACALVAALSLVGASGPRGAWFFAPAALMPAILAFDGLTRPQATRRVQALLVLEAILVAAFWRWSLFASYEGPLGVDPWFWTEATAQMAESGRILEEVLGTLYAYLPAFPILVALVHETLGVTTLEAQRLGVGLLHVASIIPIFALGRAVGGPRVGILAAIVVAAASQHAQWGWWIIPMTMGVSFFAWLVQAQHAMGPRSGWAVVFLLMGVLILLSQMVVQVAMGVFLGGAAAGAAVWSRAWLDPLGGRSLRRAYVLVPAVLLFVLGTYWIAISHFFTSFVGALLLGERRETVAEVASAAAAPSASWLVIEANKLGFLLLLFFGLWGIFAMLRRAARAPRDLPLLMGILAVFVFSTAALVLQLNELLPARWATLVQSLLAIPAALALALLAWRVGRRMPSGVVAGLAVAFLCGGMLLNSEASFDGPLGRSLNDLYGVTPAEAALGARLASLDIGDAYSDEAYARFLRYAHDVNARPMPGDPERVPGVLLVREAALDRTISYRSGGSVLGPMPFGLEELEASGSRVYDGGAVQAYVTAS